MAWVGTDAEVLAAFGAMSDPTRRAIVHLLAARGSLPGGEVARHFDIAWSSVSRHLGLLRDAGLVTAERQGRHIVYSLNRAAFAPVVAELSELAAPRVRVPVAVLAPEMSECVSLARDTARRRGAEQLEPVDLLAGLARQQSSRAAQALRAAGVDVATVVRVVERTRAGRRRAGAKPAVDSVPSAVVWDVFQAALVIGVRRGVTGLVPAHVLEALLDETTGTVSAVLQRSGATSDAVRRALDAADGTPSARPARRPEHVDAVASEIAALRRGVEALEQRLREGARP